MSESVEDKVLAQLATEMRPLQGFLWMLTGDRALADDLLQETCLEAWRNRHRIEPEGPLGPWLRGVARNIVYRHRRRAGRERSVPFSPEAMDRLEDALDGLAEEPEAERLDDLKECLGGLSDEQRRLVAWRYEDDWSHRRIGEASGRSESAVKMMFVRIKQRLRECVERREALRIAHRKPASPA